MLLSTSTATICLFFSCLIFPIHDLPLPDEAHLDQNTPNTVHFALSCYLDESPPSRSATKVAQAFGNPEKVTGVQLAPLVKSFAKIASISSLPGNISHTAK